METNTLVGTRIRNEQVASLMLVVPSVIQDISLTGRHREPQTLRTVMVT